MPDDWFTCIISLVSWLQKWPTLHVLNYVCFFVSLCRLSVRYKNGLVLPTIPSYILIDNLKLLVLVN